MALTARTDDMIAHKRRRERETAVAAAVPLIFQMLAESGQVASTDIVRLSPLIDLWDNDCEAAEGCIRVCPLNGDVYVCTRQPSEAAPLSLRPPSQATQNWERIANPAQE